MKPDEFLSSLYLGDRACKTIVLDGWRHEVKIQINAVGPFGKIDETMWPSKLDEQLERARR
jgi:hypothetical protein